MRIKTDLYYSFKAVISALSGFDRLETRWEEEWEPVEDGLWTDPYYVCARFRNGRHLPLPLVLEPNESEFPLQKVVLLLLTRLGLLRDAKEACKRYLDSLSE